MTYDNDYIRRSLFAWRRRSPSVAASVAPSNSKATDVPGHALSRRSLIKGGLSSGAALLSISNANAASSGRIAFLNAAVFDGVSDSAKNGLTVIVENGLIADIVPANNPLEDSVRRIDCGGRTLLPGLIDAHWHCMLAPVTIGDLMTEDEGYLTLLAADEAQRTLMRGFTSVRDMAGASFSLKRAIDNRMIAGPRIWPSGAIISQSGGHGDFRMSYELPEKPDNWSRTEAINAGVVADGADAVLKRAREQLALGASQIKLAAGGGIVSHYDPIDTSQYTEREFHAAVEAAENWGTYVAVHAYVPRAIKTALKAGVRCIEHGHLMDEETAGLIGASGAWLSTQPFIDEGASAFAEGSANRRKEIEVENGTDRVYALARKLNIKVAWGTDLLFNPSATAQQGHMLAALKRWYQPAEILRMATSGNAELLALSGPRNPYPGVLGKIEKGAIADILLIDGNPLENIDLIADPGRNFRLIMKNGEIHKNTLDA